MRDDKTLFLFVFRDGFLIARNCSSARESKAVLTNVFADVGWECPQILAAMENAGDVYFDRVSQIRMNRWTKGHTALIGDAAACVSKFASAFAPKSASGIAIRNLVTRLMRILFVADFFIGRDLRDDIRLPEYGFSRTEG